MHGWQAGMTGLAVAAAFASLLVLLWRHWLAWQALERDGGAISARFSAQQGQDRST